LAQNRLFNKLVNKMKIMANNVVGAVGNSKMYYGAFYSMSYQNWKTDPRPLIFCMGQYQGANGKNYTHGFNCNYMNDSDRQWLTRTIYLLAKAGQVIDAMTFYRMIKMQRPLMIETSYRIYFSHLVNGKMVSAGFTNMHSLVYKGATAPWLSKLNTALKPSDNSIFMPAKISMNSNELQERVIMAQNSVPLNQARVARPVSSAFGGTGQAFGGNNGR
jgi:hypothetical protein